MIMPSGMMVFPFKEKHLGKWLDSYLRGLVSSRFRQRKRKAMPCATHIYFCIADHFEPKWNKPAREVERRRVDTWYRRYPKLAEKHKDFRGRPPQHTFFYPEEEYEKEYLDKLAELCNRGFGDVEVHLHHENDTAQNLRRKLVEFKTILYGRHGLLRKDPGKGEIVYGFIHGNFALDNSRKDGKYCGVSNELQILKETGCYADFTLPSAPSETQTRKINSIYQVRGLPNRNKCHNTGKDVQIGKELGEDLLIIQGPLALNWKWRKYGIFPRIENGDISHHHPPNEERVDLWVKQNICVKGMPNRIFIKVHTHGAQEGNFPILLGEPMDTTLSYLETRYNNGKNYLLFYVTAWEMFNTIKEIAAMKDGGCLSGLPPL